MKKELAQIGGLFLVVVGLVIFGNGITTAGFVKNKNESTQSAVLKKQTAIKIKTLSIVADVASKANDRKKGLSNIESIPLNKGVLFVFDNEGDYAIWMKDMKFAIDIIWINDEKKIIDIVKGARPEFSKKDSELTIFKPAEAAKYILEVNAGLIDLHNINVRDIVEFEL